jgi:hypothetical protein
MYRLYGQLVAALTQLFDPTVELPAEHRTLPWVVGGLMTRPCGGECRPMRPQVACLASRRCREFTRWCHDHDTAARRETSVRKWACVGTEQMNHRDSSTAVNCKGKAG